MLFRCDLRKLAESFLQRTRVGIGGRVLHKPQVSGFLPVPFGAEVAIVRDCGSRPPLQDTLILSAGS